MSDIETSLWQQYRDQGVIVIGISNESESTINQFVEDQSLTFPVLRDVASVYGDYFLSGGQSPYPRDFIIDQDGILRYASTEYDVNQMQNVINTLITSSSVGEPDNTVPDYPELKPAFPNPFNSTVSISVFIPEKAPVTLEIYDISGRQVSTIVQNRSMSQGNYTFRWDASAHQKTIVGSGVYLLRLHTPGFMQTRKITLVR